MPRGYTTYNGTLTFITNWDKASICHLPWVCLFDINYKLRKATRVHDDVCGLCYCLRPFWWLWYVLTPRAMLMSVICAAAGSCIDVHRPCLCCKSYWSLWSIADTGNPCWSLEEVMWLSMIQTADGCYGPWSFFCSSINNCKVIIENERISKLLWQQSPPPPPKKRNSPERKSLKIVIKILKCTLHSWCLWHGGGEELKYH